MKISFFEFKKKKTNCKFYFDLKLIIYLMFTFLKTNQTNILEEIKLLLNNRHQEYKFKNTSALNLVFKNDENDLILKFPLNGSKERDGLYSQCIKNFFLKTNERQDEILSEVFNDLNIVVRKNFLCLEKSSKLYQHYSNSQQRS